jgi:hypothetical protein
MSSARRLTWTRKTRCTRACTNENTIAGKGTLTHAQGGVRVGARMKLCARADCTSVPVVQRIRSAVSIE